MQHTRNSMNEQNHETTKQTNTNKETYEGGEETTRKRIRKNKRKINLKTIRLK